MVLIKTNTNQIEDPILFLNEEYDKINERVNLIDAIYWEIEKEGISETVNARVSELIVNIFVFLKKLYRIEEEILYPELEAVLPAQSSATAMKSEHRHIISILRTIIKTLENKEELKDNKDILQAELITIADLIRRNIHKKEKIIFHEARTLLPEKALDELHEKMKKELSFYLKRGET
ncbi:MAG: hemerythrin domain-containing protein [Chlorobi bacterium]|nr:hemerythrin domain-containing protein [Chlorobiota bacterium]MCI0715158.1 hemerythrin domain-containing protein [Chlorobiota bacterium]